MNSCDSFYWYFLYCGNLKLSLQNLQGTPGCGQIYLLPVVSKMVSGSSSFSKIVIYYLEDSLYKSTGLLSKHVASACVG